MVLLGLAVAEALFIGPIAVGIASGILSIFKGGHHGATVARHRSYGHHGRSFNYEPSRHYDHHHSNSNQYYTRPTPVRILNIKKQHFMYYFNNWNIYLYPVHGHGNVRFVLI